MDFSLTQSVELLQRTPSVLQALLSGLSPGWTLEDEGPDTWSVFDVIGHLIHGEQTDWIPRTELILSDTVDKRFIPFDRFAQFENSHGKTLQQLLEEFAVCRKMSLERLKQLNITETDLAQKGIHPNFGEVTLSQLLAAWVVHDLDHIVQIARVMAKQYNVAVGPWIHFLKVLRQ